MKRAISILLTLAVVLSAVPGMTLSAAAKSGKADLEQTAAELPDNPEIMLSEMTKDNSDLWWTFDDAVGTASVNTAVPGAEERKSVELHGTFVPGGGAVSGALRLNGTSDFVKVNNDDKPQDGNMHWAYNGYTAAFWFKAERLEGKQSLYVHGDPHSETGVAIRLNADKLEATVAAENGKPFVMDPVSIAESLNKWVHVALTFEDGAAKLYINGSLKSEKTVSAKSIAPIYSGAALGRALFKADGFGGTDDEYFKGMIDDYRLYNIAVTPKTKIQSYSGIDDINLPSGGSSESLRLPAVVEANLSKTDKVELLVSEWNSSPDFSPITDDTYLYTANIQIPDNLYAANLPKLRLTVGENDAQLSDAIIAARQALTDLTLKSDVEKQDILTAVTEKIADAAVSVSGAGLTITAPGGDKTGLAAGNITLSKGALVRNIAVNATLPKSGDVLGTASLMSAARKNHYIRDNSGAADIYYDVADGQRKWNMVKGLADDNGVSFRLAGTDRYLQVAGDELIVDMAVDSEGQKASTFYASQGEQPGWARVYDGFFEKYSVYSDRTRFIKADKQTGKLFVGTVNEQSDSDKLSASFKKTADNNEVIENLRGAVYYPSYSYNGPQFFKFYDSAVIERDMQYAQSLGINAFRIWVSYEYWLEDAEHFKKGYDDFLRLADKYGIKILVSLFEGCSDPNDYNNRNYSGSYSVTSPSSAIYDNTSRWGEPKKFVDWFMENYKDDLRQMAIEVYNEPWGTRENLAAELLKYTVAKQGDVAVSLGTAPSGAGLHSIAYSVREGVDIIQYHDNFPAAASNFENNANNKLKDAQRYNLPLYCTEVQWIGGPGNPYDSHYENLAPTCEKLRATGKWAPFYWTLMVHPAYLPNNRGVKLTNGIFQEDGTVWSSKSALAIAPEKDASGLKENKADPYSQYYYKQTYSDNFMDNHGYKWTMDETLKVENERLSGTGTAMADLTKFSNFKAKASVEGENAGVLFRAKDKNNGYAAEITDKALAIYKIEAGEKKLIEDKPLAAEGNELEVIANGSSIKAVVGNTELEVKDASFAVGQIGLISESAAAFDDVLVDAGALENPVPATPDNISAVRSAAENIISWDAVPNAESYTVARCETKNGEYKTLASKLEGTSFADATATADKTYYYTVAAENANGMSVSSASVECFAAPDRGVDVKLSEFTSKNGVLWYKLDQQADSTTAVSSVVHSSSSSLSGRFLPGGGREAGAFYFNGSSSYIKMNNDNASSGLLHDGYAKRTFSFYMCPYTLDGKQMLMKTGGDLNGIAVRINNAKLQVAVGTGDLDKAGTQYLSEDIPLGNEYINRWTHVAVTFDNAATTVYIDGKKVSEGRAGASAVAPATRSSTLGACLDVSAFRDSEAGQYFRGMLDDVRVYKDVVVPTAVSGTAGRVTATPGSGAVSVGTKVHLSTASGGAYIMYSLDNGKTWSRYSSAITLTALPVTIKAYATGDGYHDGETSVFSFTKAAVPVSGVSLSKKSVTVQAGKSVQLRAAVSPANADNRSIVWSTSNRSVATVVNGRVTGKKAGKAKITARSANGKLAVCVVTVKSHVTKLTFKKRVITIRAKKTVKLNSSKYIKTTAPVKSLRLKTKYLWYSSNKKAVRINKSTGKLKGLKRGKRVTITVKYGGKKLGSVKIRVK